MFMGSGRGKEKENELVYSFTDGQDAVHNGNINFLVVLPLDNSQVTGSKDWDQVIFQVRKIFQLKQYGLDNQKANLQAMKTCRKLAQKYFSEEHLPNM
jgi:DNA polymerase/3'-5' exonuclease PolX